MNHKELWALFDWTRSHPLSNGHIIPILQWGLAGIGKSAGVEGFCKSKGHSASSSFGFASYLPAHDTTGAGLIGTSYLNEVSMQEHYATPLWLPTNEGIETGAGVFSSENGILFIDEVNRSSPEVRNGLLELIHADKISKAGYLLPKGWSTVMAANPPDDENDVEQMDQAFMDRAVHVWLAFDIDVWCDWARSHGLTDATIEFARKNPDMMAPDDRTDLPDSVSINISPSPRSMEFLGALYEPHMSRKLLLTIAQGLIGKSEADLYMAHIAEFEAREANVRVLTVEHIMTGEFHIPLAAELSAGNGEAVTATVLTMAQGSLARHPARPEVAAHIATFLHACGQPLVRQCAQIIHEHAHETWTPLVRAAYKNQPAATVN